MSLLTSLFSGVSGLKNHQSMMDVIGNNISNVNTIGFKGSRVTFSDTFSQAVRQGSNPGLTGGAGGTNSFQIGLGMKLNSIDRDWTQGTFERTGYTTDLALQGPGLFILENNGQTFYSRAGAFTFDADGNLVVPSNGAKVQGKMATEDGVIPLGNNQEDLKVDANMKIPATPTTEINWGGNLSSNAPNTRTEVIQQSGTIPDAGGTSNRTVIYDDYGYPYEIEVIYTEDAVTPSVYDITYNVYKPGGTVAIETGTIASDLALPAAAAQAFTIDIDAADHDLGLATSISTSLDVSALAVDDTVPTNITSLADGNEDPTIVPSTVTIYDSLGNPYSLTVRFTKTADNNWNWYGSLADSASGTLSNNFGTVSFNADGSLSGIVPPTPIINFTPSGGADAQSISLNFGTLGQFDGITQTSSDSVVSAISQNGSAAASLASVNVDQYGKIVGIFSNGASRDLGQILLATFQNLGCLQSVGDNMLQKSVNAGEPFIGEPGENTSTTIQAGALETSNVDLAEEFTRMIIAQRGFQANARVITVSDGLLQEISNLVR